MQLDHVSYAVRDSEIVDTVQRLGAELGAAFVDGGKHPRFGTRNFILPLGAGTYVEVVSALDHPAAESAPFGRAVRERAEAGGGWLGWVVRVPDLDPIESRLGRESALGHRVRPDGTDVTWRQIGILDLLENPHVPYFIKWDNDDLHPSTGGSPDVTICCLNFTGSRNAVDDMLGGEVSELLDGVCLNWDSQDENGLASVTFKTPHGEITID